MHSIHFEGRVLTAPSNLNELSGAQLRALVAIQSARLSAALQPWAVLGVLVTSHRRWLGWWYLKNYIWLPFWGQFVNVTIREISDEKLNDLLELTHWFHQDRRPLIEQLQPVIWVRLWGWVPVPLRGPSKALTTCTYRQFRRCEKILSQPGQPNAAAVIGLLYSVPAPFRWFRSAVQRAISRVDEQHKDAVILTYLGTRKALHAKFKYLFPKKRASDDVDAQILVTPGQIERDYENLRRSMAESIINEEAVDLMPLWDALGWANYEAEKDHFRKIELEKSRRK